MSYRLRNRPRSPQLLLLSGRASEREIRRSDFRFLIGTQNFFLCPTLVTRRKTCFSLSECFTLSSTGLPLTLTDNIERLIVCDTNVTEFRVKHLPVHVDTNPRVVTLKDKPFIASLVSESAVIRFRGLEREIRDDIGERGIAELHIADELLRAALVLSHSSSVGIHFGFPCNTNKEFPD